MGISLLFSSFSAFLLTHVLQGPDGLTVSSLPDVQPAPDQYLIAVHAAAANFFDILQIQGKYQNQPRKRRENPRCTLHAARCMLHATCYRSPQPSLTYLPCQRFPGWPCEFSGEVLATPRASHLVKPRFAVGDRVFGASQGAYATKVCATESQLCPVPSGWSYREAAGLFVTAPTSYAGLVLRANIRSGDYVLVHAAAGGVGLAAVQSACLAPCLVLRLLCSC